MPNNTESCLCHSFLLQWFVFLYRSWIRWKGRIKKTTPLVKQWNSLWHSALGRQNCWSVSPAIRGCSICCGDISEYQWWHLQNLRRWRLVSELRFMLKWSRVVVVCLSAHLFSCSDRDEIIYTCIQYTLCCRCDICQKASIYKQQPLQSHQGPYRPWAKGGCDMQTTTVTVTWGTRQTLG